MEFLAGILRCFKSFYFSGIEKALREVEEKVNRVQEGDEGQWEVGDLESVWKKQDESL